MTNHSAEANRPILAALPPRDWRTASRLDSGLRSPRGPHRLQIEREPPAVAHIARMVLLRKKRWSQTANTISACATGLDASPAGAGGVGRETRKTEPAWHMKCTMPHSLGGPRCVR